MSLYLDNYTAILTPEYAVYGIQPTDNTLPKAENCNCGPPTYKCRKQLRYYVSYTKGEIRNSLIQFVILRISIIFKLNLFSSAMENPATQDFLDMKAEIERKVTFTPRFYK
jgi:hypothetical protein